jgi:hypothetical protein
MSGRGWAALIVACMIAATGCAGADDATSDAVGAATTQAEPRETPSAEASPDAVAAGSAETLFEDAFADDRNGWGVVDDPNYGTAGYADGDYVWDFRGSVAHWLPEALAEQHDAGLDLRDVVVRADVTIVSGGGVVGVGCRENPDTDADYQWYEFVARDGYAAIRRVDAETNIDVLAETKDVALPLGQPMTIEGVCVDDADGTAQLSLTLDDVDVVNASDADPLAGGVPSIQAYTHPAHQPMGIRWHSFTVGRPDSSARS